MPKAIASAQESLTQKGMEPVSVQLPEAMSERVMTPIVFCASLVPWASDTSEALTIWPQRKPVSLKRSETAPAIR